MPMPVELVESYIATSQRARATGLDDDFEILRSFLAPDVTVRIASPWTDEPWRTVLTSADALVAQLRTPMNQGTRLTTENLNVVQVGDDVLVEQLSTITTDAGAHRSVVCHIFTVADGLIAGIRTYRNDAGLPAG